MAAFPAGTLTRCDQIFISNVERSEMESGPVKQAPRIDKQRIHYECEFTFSASEYTDFMTFYRTTIRNGSDFFDWTDPFENIAHTNAVIVEGNVKAMPFSQYIANKVVRLKIEVWV